MPVHLKVLEDGVFLNGELAGYCHLMANAKAHLFLCHHPISGKFRPVVHATWAFAWHIAEFCMTPVLLLHMLAGTSHVIPDYTAFGKRPLLALFSTLEGSRSLGFIGSRHCMRYS